MLYAMVLKSMHLRHESAFSITCYVMAPTLQKSLRNEYVLKQLIDDPSNFRFPEAPIIKVGAEIWSPHVEDLVKERDGNWKIVGPAAKALHLMAQAMNFTYVISRPADSAWGAKNPDGTWTGMVGMVYRKEVDMAVGPFANTWQRAEVVDYLPPLAIDSTQIVVAQAPPESNPFGFLGPFPISMWLGLGISWIFVSILLFFTTGVLSSVQSRAYNLRIMDVLIEQWGILLQQTNRVSSPYGTIRLLLGSWFLFCMIAMKSYGGVLVSMLAAKYIPRPIDSLQDVVDHPYYKIAFDMEGAYIKDIENAEVGAVSRLKEFFETPRLINVLTPDYHKGMEMVNEENIVLMAEGLSLKALVASDFSNLGQCRFYMPRDYFLQSIYSMIAQKGNPIVQALSLRTSTMTSYGLYDKWLTETMPNSTMCLKQPATVSVSEAYSLKGLWGIFALLGTGLLIGALIYALERQFHCLDFDVGGVASRLMKEEII